MTIWLLPKGQPLRGGASFTRSGAPLDSVFEKQTVSNISGAIVHDHSSQGPIRRPDSRLIREELNDISCSLNLPILWIRLWIVEASTCPLCNLAGDHVVEVVNIHERRQPVRWSQRSDTTTVSPICLEGVPDCPNYPRVELWCPSIESLREGPDVFTLPLG